VSIAEIFSRLGIGILERTAAGAGQGRQRRARAQLRAFCASR
jgi:hypothetical protein